MKTIFIVTVCALILIITGCDKDRVDAPPLKNTEANYFADVTQFRKITFGIYAKLYDYYHYNAGDNGNWANSLWLLPGDDLTETNGSRTAEELFDGTLRPDNIRVEWIFDKTYEMISKSNVIIDKVNSVDFSAYDGADEIPYMEGEALFLRSYAYYNLFNIYGNVPIVTQRFLNADEANTPKSDHLEVLEQVITDAKAALAILPESWSAEYRGRATKNSARALLTKALVFKANYSGSNDYTEAITTFNAITATLSTRYLDNFDVATENNQESLFEIQAGQPSAFSNIFLENDGPWRGVEDLSIFRGMMSVAGSTSISNYANTRFLITDKLFNAFGTDPRISYFLRADDNEGGRLFQKYTLAELDQQQGNVFDTSSNNERVLRYGDLILLIAEAHLKSGNPSTAIQLVNNVRKRARDWGLASGTNDGTVPADYSTSETNIDTIMKWIMDERFIELAGEGQRWWDLKRWHVAGDINLTGWTGDDAQFSTNLSSSSLFDVSKHLLFPLPQKEVERNSEILENNPGY